MYHKIHPPWFYSLFAYLTSKFFIQLIFDYYLFIFLDMSFYLNYLSSHLLSPQIQVAINATVLSWRENNTCFHTSSTLAHSGQEFESLVCPSGCPLECQVTVPEQCQHPDDPSNSPKTFWVYFGLRMISTFFLASAFTMLVCYA